MTARDIPTAVGWLLSLAALYVVAELLLWAVSAR